MPCFGVYILWSILYFPYCLCIVFVSKNIQHVISNLEVTACRCTNIFDNSGIYSGLTRRNGVSFAWINMICFFLAKKPNAWIDPTLNSGSEGVLSSMGKVLFDMSMNILDCFKKILLTYWFVLWWQHTCSMTTSGFLFD